MAVSGPLARSVHDLRLGLAAMAAPDPRDPWWVPAPLAGPDLPRKVALCVRPDGLETQPPVAAALLDAAERLRDAGWSVDELDQLPPIRDACAVQIALWMGDGYEASVEAAAREGDEGAITALAGQAQLAAGMTAAKLSAALVRRAGIVRRWQQFLEQYPVVLLPPCAELPFPADLDLQGEAAYRRVWAAQMTMIGLPVTGLPALVVSTGLAADGRPVGVQLLAGRYREDLCLAAGEAIEARGSPPLPVD
jgi:amidase